MNPTPETPPPESGPAPVPAPPVTADKNDRRRKIIWGLGFAAAAVLAFVVFVILPVQKKMNRSEQEANIQNNFRGISSAAEQLFLENPYRIFVEYDELVGPERYNKSLIADTGADYHALFPIRRGQTDFLDWSVMLSDGRLFAFHPKEKPKPDGVDVVQLPKSGRFETTYHGGVPDGPFHAYYADGKLWGEATYVNGHITGPAWLYTRDGQKFDELTNGKAAEHTLEGR